MSEGEKIKDQLQENKKTCYSSSMDVLAGGNNKLQYIEQKMSALIVRFNTKFKAIIWKGKRSLQCI
jgi:hypothetical protein